MKNKTQLAMINKRTITVAFLLISFLMISQNKVEVNVLKLSGDLINGKLSVQSITPNIEGVTVKKSHKIKLYPKIEFQTLEGIGGAFNEIGGVALMTLPKALQDEVMTNIFSVQHGAGFSFCRTAVGASDFGVDAYSYAEKADDYKMTNFSIKREETSVIPYIQMAYNKNPKLKMFASPWSPPAWMKYSGLMDRGEEFPEKNVLKDDPKIYEAYALYFAKYIKAYADKGITIDRLVIQNENDANTPYPSCDMSASQMSNFAKNYLRPQFKSDKIKTEIWAGTFRTTSRLDAIEIAATPEYIAAFDGIGIQYTRPEYIEQMNSFYPNGKTMHTEGNCDNGKNTWEQASKRLNEIATYINRGIPNYCYWNMILNETTASGWNWKQNSLINIDRQTKQVTYNPDFAVVAFMSKYLAPGAKRIANFSKDVVITVKHNDTIYILVQNTAETAQTYEWQIESGKVQTVEIPTQSLAAIIIKQ